MAGLKLTRPTLPLPSDRAGNTDMESQLATGVKGATRTGLVILANSGTWISVLFWRGPFVPSTTSPEYVSQ